MILLRSSLCSLKTLPKSLLYLIRRKATKMNDLPVSSVFFRRFQDSDTFQVTFHAQLHPYKIDRQFNFSRRLEENVQDFLARVKCNVEKCLNAKKKKKSKDKEESSVEVNVDILVDGEVVPGSTKCSEVFFNPSRSGQRVMLRLLNHDFHAVFNSPWVSTLSLPSSIMAGFPVYPNKFELIFATNQTSQFTWSKKVFNDWVDVGTGFLYVPTNSDINCQLRLTCTPSDGSNFGPSMSAISPKAVEAGPGYCPFETRHLFTRNKVPDNCIRVISYNILADLYAETEAARTQLFPYCPAYAIALDYRKQLYFKEIIGYNSDILCLQEVDGKVFDYDLNLVLDTHGFSGVLEKKSGVGEGVATFYQRNKFKLLEQYKSVLGEEVTSNPLYSGIWDKVQKNANLTTRLKERSTVLLISVLQNLTHPKSLVMVANTHLYFHPDADHIRLLQGGMAMLFIEHTYRNLSVQFPDYKISLIFCGDFNSTPDCGIYQLLTTNAVPASCADWNSKPDEKVEGLVLKQSIPMASACGTPAYTNYTAGFKECIDYIFYQRNHFSVEQVVPFPSEDEVSQHVAIPSVVAPSDHLALIADLKYLS